MEGDTDKSKARAQRQPGWVWGRAQGARPARARQQRDERQLGRPVGGTGSAPQRQSSGSSGGSSGGRGGGRGSSGRGGGGGGGGSSGGGGGGGGSRVRLASQPRSPEVTRDRPRWCGRPRLTARARAGELAALAWRARREIPRRSHEVAGESLGSLRFRGAQGAAAADRGARGEGDCRRGGGAQRRRRRGAGEACAGDFGTGAR